MDILLTINISLVAIGLILSIFTLFTKKKSILNTMLVMSCIFIAFVGFMNFSSLPSNYTKQRLLALFTTLTISIPFFLNLFKSKFKSLEDNKIDMIVKVSNMVAIFLNLILLFY